MEISFVGQKVLVTGASRGIGREIVIKLVQCGAEVVAVSRALKDLELLKQECPTVTIISVNLGNWDETRKALSNVKNVDCLVNNAGVAVLENFFDITEKSVDTSFDLNVKAIINISQLVAADMIARKVPGTIVNLSSQASMAALKNHTVYCGTKGAVDSVSRVMALELGKHNIRVNCVNPTVIMTEMGKLGWEDPAKAGPMLEKIPLHRFGTPEEVANAVLFLLSQKSTMITGVSLLVDGGFVAC